MANDVNPFFVRQEPYEIGRSRSGTYKRDSEHFLKSYKPGDFRVNRETPLSSPAPARWHTHLPSSTLKISDLDKG
jgi:hypothetical protein